MLIAPQRIVSFRQMLTLFAPSVVMASYQAGLIAQEFVAKADQGELATVPVEHFETLAASIDAIGSVGDQLGLHASKSQATRLMDSLKRHASSNTPGRMRSGELREIGFALHSLCTTFSDELDAMVLVVARRGDAELLKNDAEPFGPEVEKAFPSASYDLAEAGRCRAFYRWTATVMHIMRALEPGLLALQAAVQVNVPKEQWGQAIDQIESRIRDITKKSHGKADEKWYSEAAAHFRIIKNAWRNHSQHLHEHYDEERAVAIYDSARHFMRHLATRLAE